MSASSAELAGLVAAGGEVLDNMPRRPFACVPLTALWVVIARDRLNLPVVQVAGDLYVDGVPAFASDATAATLSRRFDRSTPSWDGHSWLAFGDFVGDISVLITAAHLPVGSRLKSVVRDRVGWDAHLLFAPRHELAGLGLEYRAKYTLTDDQVSACARGARALLA